MSGRVMIVRKGTPESKLLHSAGIAMWNLQVQEWRGRRRAKGGFGRSPVAWRVEGEDVIRLCRRIVAFLGTEPTSELNAAEKKSLKRAEGILSAAVTRAEKVQEERSAAETRGSSISLVLKDIFPMMSDSQVLEVSHELGRKSTSTFNDLLQSVEALVGSPRIRGRADALKALRSLMGRE